MLGVALIPIAQLQDLAKTNSLKLMDNYGWEFMQMVSLMFP